MDVHHRIRDIFEAAVDLPPERRAAFLRERCGSDETVHAEVARLVAAYEDGFDPQAGGRSADDVVGRQIGFGAYEIVRELGSGGMGAVYLARRVDGTFERQVAVKVIRPDKVAPSALERFTRERRLLARIQHPGIATLHDAGSTEDGMPYFVMEYVDGLPISAYCDRHRLDVRARVALFQKVCEAVAFAHRVPIVHCDLKPANIFVAADGTPRVLDFGIATALTPGGQEAEPPLEPYGSPRYASPEQLRGEPLQTSSDIYSLGVVLHELLIGQAPVSPATQTAGRTSVPPSAVFGAGDQTSPRIDNPTQIAALRNTNVATLQGTVAGDLDAVLARCLQPSPELRYHTVDALQDDLQRWLEGRPVLVRPQTTTYVLSRFISRHRWSVAAGVAAAILILAGAGIALYQWRAAERERAAAERRFNDVRQLATSLFDVDAALAGLAGATDARRAIVENASRYLDRLSQDGITDPALSLEIAESYRRLGDMLGNPNVPNLGQRPQALEKYEAADRHAAAAAAVRPDRTSRLTQARIAASRGDVLLPQGALADARTSYEQSAALVRGVLDESGDDISLRQTLAGVYRPLGDVSLAEGKPDEALKIFEQARALDLAVLAGRPDDAGSQRLLALTELRIGDALAAAGHRPDAIGAYKEAARLLGVLSARDPAQARLARDVAVARMKLARLLDADDDPRAVTESEQATETLRQLARLDPRNAGAQRDLMVSLQTLGDIVSKSEPGRGRARATYGEALRVAEMLSVEPFDDPEAERDLRVIRERLASGTDAAPAADPQLRLSVVRNGTEVPVDTGAAPPAVGEDLRVSWRPAAGRVQYVLSLGGEGRATLIRADELAARGGRLRTDGPPPSQTLLLLSVPRPLADTERAELVDRVSLAPGPREVPLKGHILWRTEREVLDSTATARGDERIDWTAAIRRALERIPGARFDGRTFPIARR